MGRIDILQEFFKSPIPNLLALFNLHRISGGPSPPVIQHPSGTGMTPQPQTKDQFQRPSQTIADVIKKRGKLNRIQKYAIYAEMERDPLNVEIATAYAEAVTTINYDKGVVFWAESPQNPEIAEIVNEMFKITGSQEKAFADVYSMYFNGDTFDGIVYTKESRGIVTMKPYDPWKVARVQDEFRRLTGYSPANPNGDPMDLDKAAVPPWDILHLHLLAKDRETFYGTSLFDSSWEQWEDLQSMEDQVVLQRLLRRADRIMILMDTTGMSMQEAFEQIHIWESFLFKEINVNVGSRVFESRRAPITENRDLIIPKGPGNNTEVRNFPSTRNDDKLRDLEMKLTRYIGTHGMPKGYFGFEGGDYRSDVSLARQDPRFAKRAQRGQFAFLMGKTRLGMIHLALRGLDPLRDANRFEVHGMPISNFLEIEYNELLQMRYDLVDRMARTADDLNLNTKVWVNWILRNVAKMPKDLVDALMTVSESADMEDAILKMDPGKRKELEEATKDAENYIEKMEVLEGSLKACRVFSGPDRGMVEEDYVKFKEKDSQDSVTPKFEESSAIAAHREYQMQRAKDRLEVIEAMASSVG